MTGRGTIQNCRKQNWILDQTICYMTAVLVEETFQPPWEIRPETTVGSWQQTHSGDAVTLGSRHTVLVWTLCGKQSQSRVRHRVAVPK